MVDQLPKDAGSRIMELFVAEIIRRLEEDPAELKAADFEMIRKLLSDNSITLASIKRGDFGEMAQRVAEEYPFPDEDGGRTVQ